MAVGKRRLSIPERARMSCEKAWNRVRELGGQAAAVHKVYVALVGPLASINGLSVTPEVSRAIAETRERYNQADEAFGSAIQAAIREQHWRHPLANSN